MIFKKWSPALVALMLIAPLSASALGISIQGVTSTGLSPTLLENGDVVTFNLLLENDSYEEIFGLGVGAYGYDEGAVGSAADNHLVFAGGLNANNVFSQFFSGGQSFGGISSVGGVSEDGAPFPFLQERRVQIFNGAELVSTTGDGQSDAGFDGTQISAGGVHFQVSFRAQDLGANALNPANVTLEFGTGRFGNVAVGDGGSILPFNNATYALTIVPEPGTALLMGLGLAGLAVNRRR